MQPSTQAQADDLEPEELVRFRQDWLRELEQPNDKRRPGLDHDRSASAIASAPPASKPDHSESSQTIAGGPTASSLQTSHGTTVPTRGLTSAIDTYCRAVEAERRSQLDDALRLYRQAFRMDSNVDKAYHKEMMQQKSATGVPPQGLGHKQSNSDTAAIDNLTREVGSLYVKHKGASGGDVTGTLAKLLENFPQDLVFEPEDDRNKVPLNLLPDELLVLILRSLDPTGIERFATVNRKARLVSLDSTIWRELAQVTYKPPQIRPGLAIEVIADHYMSDYRRFYIEHPRLRLDGVYIAVCHYVRAGLSETAWVNMNHLITYHRYLRFFPSGQVLSLLANEELNPKLVIPLLKPNLRMKGLFIGDWHLDGTRVHVTNLVDASAKATQPLPTTYSPSSESTLAPTPTVTSNSHYSTTTSYSTRYVFQMTLTIRSRPLGRWNKLDFDAYDSVDLESGETIPLSLKHERAFWFSKVRSYAV